MNEKLMKESLQMLVWSMLKELGVTSMGEALCILKEAKKTASQTNYSKTPAAKLPQLKLEMTLNNSGNSKLIGMSSLR